jgi:hypothetical protein
VRDDRWIERRIRDLEREVADLSLGAAEEPDGPDRRFVLGALHQRQGRSLEAARWYLVAARAAEARGQRAAARALVLLARELAPTLLEAVRAQRRYAAETSGGKDG